MPTSAAAAAAPAVVDGGGSCRGGGGDGAVVGGVGGTADYKETCLFALGRKHAWRIEKLLREVATAADQNTAAWNSTPPATRITHYQQEAIIQKVER